MSFASFKAIANASLVAAKGAAIAAKDATAKAMHDMGQTPTAVPCTHCGIDIPVPDAVHFYDWACETPACVEKGSVNNKDAKTCTVCLLPRPESSNADKTVQCAACRTVVVVPRTNAGKMMQSAKNTVVNAAISAKDYTVKTYEELKSAPTTVYCKQCNKEVDIPQDRMSWPCTKEGCGAINPSSNTACGVCNQPASAERKEPVVACPTCAASIAIPSSNASKKVGVLTHKTKLIAASASATIQNEWKQQTAAPRTFHCSHCAELLHVPDVWVCQKCTAQNVRDRDDESKNKVCGSCQHKRGSNDDQVLCGKCQQATVIPSSNFANTLRTETNVLNRSVTKLFHDVTGKPYVVCDCCKTTVPLPKKPAPANEGNAAGNGAAYEQLHDDREPLLLTCPKCNKHLEARH